MRILLVNQPFHPDVAATAQHAYDLARHLVRQGHQVRVIASRSLYGRKGAVLPRREVIDGIEVRRVGVNFFGRRGELARAADFALFYLAVLLRAPLGPRPDVVITLTTPPLIALVGWLVRLLRGSRWVYWLMDLYPDIPVACGLLRPRNPLVRLWERLHRFCLRRADRVVVLGRCMSQRVLDKGVDAARLAQIGVWSDAEEVAPAARLENPLRGEWGLGAAFVVMYAGNYSYAHDVDTMCQAALALRDRAEVRFVFAGGGRRKAEVEQFLAEHHLANAQCRPFQPRQRLGQLLTLADLHLVSQSPGMEGLFVPSKVYGVLASGRPVAFIGPPAAEAGRAVEEAGCGRVIACGQAAALARFIVELVDDPALAARMGERARQALERRHSRALRCRQWQELLESLGPVGGR